jgi:hypothetical protein
MIDIWRSALVRPLPQRRVGPINAMGTAWLAKLERGCAGGAARLYRVVDVIRIG